MVVAKIHELRYAITGLHAQRLEQPADREARMRAQARRWAVDRVDIVQLREKQLQSGDLLRLARAALEEFALSGVAPPPQLLVNGRPDVALAAGATGVHLTSRAGELTPLQVRRAFRAAGRNVPTVSISCHSLEEVASAKESGADLILFGPVFEKRAGDQVVADGVGLKRLKEACDLAAPLPVLALGGVTEGNAPSCLEAGAGGIAGIRLFA